MTKKNEDDEELTKMIRRDLSRLDHSEETVFDPNLAMKALFVIEELTAGNEYNTLIYQLAHVGRGGCIRHQAWEDELEETFKRIVGNYDPPPPPPLPMSVNEAALVLDIHPESLRRLTRQGKIPHYRLGKKSLYFNEADIRRFKETFVSNAGNPRTAVNKQTKTKQVNKLKLVARVRPSTKSTANVQVAIEVRQPLKGGHLLLKTFQYPDGDEEARNREWRKAIAYAEAYEHESED